MCRAQNRSFLNGYMAGLFDTHAMIATATSSNNPLCVPKAVSLGQLTDIACKYLSEHPEERHLNGASLAFWAVHKAFPCTPDSASK
jgi:hypothetical protein